MPSHLIPHWMFIHTYVQTQYNTCMHMGIYTKNKVIKINIDSDCKDGWTLDYVIEVGILQTHKIFIFRLYKLFSRNEGTRQTLAEFILWSSPTWTHMCVLHMKTALHTYTHKHTHRASVHERDRLNTYWIWQFAFSKTS